ncbi:MAG TPA: PKD domain-containing protein [Bacteroidia bacterium]|jgi:gliding motility-associated-like protein
MFKKTILFFWISLLFLVLPSISKASHLAGGEITYVCLGNNQYQINLNLYWDCSGGFYPGATQTLNLTSTCGGSASLTVNQTNTGGNGQGTDISQVCGGVTSTCSGGTFPGMNMCIYSGVVTLAPPCDTWTISFSTCCRNTSIDNVSGANYYIEATLNSATAACNSSPYFTAQPIPYVCTNQLVNYSFGVVETDGDSLYYSLVDALDGAGVSSTYYPGYSGSAPLPGTTIDPNTGLLSFTPTTIGNYVFVILVQEYDSNGDLVGTIMRDIQFVVQSCANIVPDNAGGAITNFGGNSVQTGPYSLEMCAGNCFNFTASFTDSNPGDSLSYISNILSALPGAVITSSGINPLVLDISWCSPMGSMGQNLTFTITIEDDYCPIPGQQTYAYSVNILDATTASPDITICGAQTAQLNAYGGSIFNWTVINGDPITPANFSCNPCANPIASPSMTTTYEVVSNLSGTCDNIDTVTVFVVPNFSYTATQSSANSCLQDPVQLNVTGLTPAGNYNFQWSPATHLDNALIQNPTATFTAPGSYTYTLTVTSAAGCTQSSSMTIVAVPAFSPQITASNDTSFCGGGTVNLGLTFSGSSVPPTCGISATGGCGGTALTGIVGTGTTTNTATTWPAIFGNWYTSTKHQMLYTAAELNAAGIAGGKIDQVDFMITMISGISAYHGFTISMGCTNLQALGTTWVTGLVQVFNPKTVNIAVGWNNFVFDNSFEWDGLSNIVVEVCSTEGPGQFGYGNYTQSSSSPFTTTPFTSCLYSVTDQFDMCPNTTNFITQTTSRPNIQFHYCSLTPNPASFTYSWTPASGAIANATAQNTTAVPPVTMDYFITVTDASGGCSDTDTVHVDVININTLAVTPDGPYCVNGNQDTLQASVPVGTGVWSGPGVIDPVLGIFSPALANVGTHEVFYTVTGACGSGVDSMDLVVTTTPDATITQVGNQCINGTTIFLTAATPGGTWSGGGVINPSTGEYDPAQAGVGNDTILYVVTSPCYAQDTMVIPVTLQMDATVTHVGPFCAVPTPVTMQAVDPGGVWSGPGITNSSTGIFDPFVAGPGSHTITYTISGACGAVGTDNIIVMPSPTIDFVADTLEGCEPTTVQFTSTVNQPGGTSLWSFGDALSGVNDTSTTVNPSHVYNYAGSYHVTYIYANAIGCSDTVTKTDFITIHSQPVALFTSSPQPTSMVDPEVDFTDHSTGVIDSWHWEFGYMNDTSILQNPSYVYPDSGLYPVELIVTNIHQCADTAYMDVYIDPVLVFYAPNAFSPNGNGNNDVFRVYGDGIDKNNFEMTIYNRWGERIFKTNKYEEGWNGALNNTGELVGQDAYVYKINFRDFSGKKHQYIGHVTIVK